MDDDDFAVLQKILVRDPSVGDVMEALEGSERSASQPKAMANEVGPG